MRRVVILTAAPPAVLTRYSRGTAGTRAVWAVSTLRRLRTARARPPARNAVGRHTRRTQGRTGECSALPPVCRVRLSLRCARLSAADRSPGEARHFRPRLLPLAHSRVQARTRALHVDYRLFVRRACLCAERARRSKAAVGTSAERERGVHGSAGKAFMSAMTGLQAALTSGIRTWGYSEHSQGVLWVLKGVCPQLRVRAARGKPSRPLMGRAPRRSPRKPACVPVRTRCRAS
jgi:hypothetical protein